MIVGIIFLSNVFILREQLKYLFYNKAIRLASLSNQLSFTFELSIELIDES